jgi:phage tail protein X
VLAPGSARTLARRQLDNGTGVQVLVVDAAGAVERVVRLDRDTADHQCRRHHNAKTLGVVRTKLTAGPGTGPRTVHWSLPAGVQVTTSPEPLPGTLLRRQPTTHRAD